MYRLYSGLWQEDVQLTIYNSPSWSASCFFPLCFLLYNTRRCWRSDGGWLFFPTFKRMIFFLFSLKSFNILMADQWSSSLYSSASFDIRSSPNGPSAHFVQYKKSNSGTVSLVKSLLLCISWNIFSTGIWNVFYWARIYRFIDQQP